MTFDHDIGQSVSRMTMEEVLLLVLSLLFSLTSLGLLTIIKRFILSKPPGRRLVTSDVHILQASNTPWKHEFEMGKPT